MVFLIHTELRYTVNHTSENITCLPFLSNCNHCTSTPMNYAKTSNAKFHENRCHASLPRTENVKGEKGKFPPKTSHEDQEGEYMFSSTLSLTTSVDGVGGQATPRPLYPWERLGTHCIGGWVGPRSRSDGCGKSRLHRETIPVPSRP